VWSNDASRDGSASKSLRIFSDNPTISYQTFCGWDSVKERMALKATIHLPTCTFPPGSVRARATAAAVPRPTSRKPDSHRFPRSEIRRSTGTPPSQDIRTAPDCQAPAGHPGRADVRPIACSSFKEKHARWLTDLQALLGLHCSPIVRAVFLRVRNCQRLTAISMIVFAAIASPESAPFAIVARTTVASSPDPLCQGKVRHGQRGRSDPVTDASTGTRAFRR
jgi:hypothetical protein